MLNFLDSSQCCGCGSCANACPKGCILMRPDEEGFLYPQAEEARCIHCGLCETVCPVLHPPLLPGEPEAYAAKHVSDAVKLKSSSGGIFSALAQPILAAGGVVFGAGFDGHWEVRHQYAENEAELDNLRRSKYVQSDIGQTFRRAKNFLDSGREVFFTGTPCQIAGLKNFLGKEYPRLLTADVICHAVPSPAVWRLFLRQTLPLEQIRSINFREKHFDWPHFYLSFLTPNGLCAHGNARRLTERLGFRLQVVAAAAAALIYHNAFLKGFLKELFNRPSCHSCAFKGMHRGADFTLGDLWGNWEGLIRKRDRRFGVSALLVNTEKGRHFLMQVPNIEWVPVPLEKVARFNPALCSSTKAHARRTEFFARYQTEPLHKLIPQMLGEKPLWIQIPLSVYHKIRRKVFHR